MRLGSQEALNLSKEPSQQCLFSYARIWNRFLRHVHCARLSQFELFIQQRIAAKNMGREKVIARRVSKRLVSRRFSGFCIRHFKAMLRACCCGHDIGGENPEGTLPSNRFCPQSMRCCARGWWEAWFGFGTGPNKSTSQPRQPPQWQRRSGSRHRRLKPQAHQPHRPPRGQ